MDAVVQEAHTLCTVFAESGVEGGETDRLLVYWGEDEEDKEIACLDCERDAEISLRGFQAAMRE